MAATNNISDIIRDLHETAERFERDIKTHSGTDFLYNIADAQNRYMRKIAERLEKCKEAGQ